jgi:hypothetical protein
MRGTRNFLPKCGLQVFDLLIRDRSSLPFIANESEHPRNPQHLQSFFSRLVDLNEGVAAEHGNFHSSPAVTPIVNFTKQRKKCANSPLFELCGNSFFMPGDRMNRVPARLYPRAISQRKLPNGFQVCWGAIHSFALSVTVAAETSLPQTFNSPNFRSIQLLTASSGLSERMANQISFARFEFRDSFRLFRVLFRPFDQLVDELRRSF